MAHERNTETAKLRRLVATARRLQRTEDTLWLVTQISPYTIDELKTFVAFIRAYRKKRSPLNDRGKAARLIADELKQLNSESWFLSTNFTQLYATLKGIIEKSQQKPRRRRVTGRAGVGMVNSRVQRPGLIIDGTQDQEAALYFEYPVTRGEGKSLFPARFFLRGSEAYSLEQLEAILMAYIARSWNDPLQDLDSLPETPEGLRNELQQHMVALFYCPPTQLAKIIGGKSS